MKEMVILKYHGIKLGEDEDGNPVYKETYRGGAYGIVVSRGGYTDPVPLEEAARLQRDFGRDTWEIVSKAGIPETADEVADAEKQIEEFKAMVAEEAAKLPAHITEVEMEAQEKAVADTDGEVEVKVRRKKAFDKTVRPAKYKRNTLMRQSKAELERIFKQVRKYTRGVKMKIMPGMTKADYVEKILQMQG